MCHPFLEKIGAERAVMITSNGARVRDLQGNLLYSNSLPEELVLELYKTPFDTSKVCMNSYQDEGWFTNKDIPAMRQFHKESGFDYNVVDFFLNIMDVGQKKVFLLVKRQRI